MHLAVGPRQPPVGVEHHRSVVVKAGSPTLEDRAHDHNLKLAGYRGEFLGGGTGHRLGEVEVRMVFGLTEIERPEELGQTDDLGATTAASRMPASAAVRLAPESFVQRI